MQIFKSAAFIDDSDDDDEADRLFFEREKQLRDEMRIMAEQNGHVMASNGRKRKRDKVNSKGKGKGGKERHGVVAVDSDEEMEEPGLEGQEDEDGAMRVMSESESDDELLGRRKRVSMDRPGSDSDKERSDQSEHEARLIKSKSVIDSDDE